MQRKRTNKICKECKKVFSPDTNAQIYCHDPCDWYILSLEDIKERSRKYYLKNGEHIKQKAKDWKDKNYLRMYLQRQNKYNENNGIAIKTSLEEFTKWFEKQDKRCYYCGIPEKFVGKKEWMIITARLTFDKKIPELGYYPENIVLACYKCNAIKSNVFTFDEMIEIGQKYIKPKWQKIFKYGC